MEVLFICIQIMKHATSRKTELFIHYGIAIMYSVIITAHAFWSRKHSPFYLRHFPLLFKIAKSDLFELTRCSTNTGLFF
jgi:hypothetical protein